MPILSFDCRFHYPHGFSLDLAFTADDGVTAIVGPSGSGKTTVLNLIAGLMSPADGQITLNGKALFSSVPSIDVAPERRRVGYVFQHFELFPHLTVEDNLRYGLRRSDRNVVDYAALVNTLELGDCLKRMPGTLSGGQKQRTAIGRAVLTSPDLLLLDEPLNALEPDLRQSISAYLRQLLDQVGIPTILVSHDAHSVASFHAKIVSTRPEAEKGVTAELNQGKTR